MQKKLTRVGTIKKGLKQAGIVYNHTYHSTKLNLLILLYLCTVYFLHSRDVTICYVYMIVYYLFQYLFINLDRLYSN